MTLTLQLLTYQTYVNELVAANTSLYQRVAVVCICHSKRETGRAWTANMATILMIKQCLPNIFQVASFQMVIWKYYRFRMIDEK